MFELTINGRTEQFETAAEMAEWRERMRSVVPKKKKKRKTSTNKNLKKENKSKNTG